MPGCVASTFGAVPISSTGSRSFSVSNGSVCRNGLTAWVSNTNSQLLPSGGDFATCAAPMLAGGAGLVLDDDGGAEPLLQPGLHHACDRIDRAAGRERHHDPGDVARSGLREGGVASGCGTAPSTSERRLIVVIASSLDRRVGRCCPYCLPMAARGKATGLPLRRRQRLRGPPAVIPAKAGIP